MIFRAAKVLLTSTEFVVWLWKEYLEVLITFNMHSRQRQRNLGWVLSSLGSRLLKQLRSGDAPGMDNVPQKFLRTLWGHQMEKDGLPLLGQSWIGDSSRGVHLSQGLVHDWRGNRAGDWQIDQGRVSRDVDPKATCDEDTLTYGHVLLRDGLHFLPVLYSGSENGKHDLNGFFGNSGYQGKNGRIQAKRSFLDLLYSSRCSHSSSPPFSSSHRLTCQQQQQV